MTIKYPVFRKSEQLFAISYSIFLFFSILLHSFYYRYFAGGYKFIILFCILLLVVQELINKTLSVKATVVAILLYSIAIFVIIQGTGNTQTVFACVFLYAFSARDVEFRKIGIVTAHITAVLLIFVVLSAVLGIVPNYLAIDSMRRRYYLGFRYALNAPSFFQNFVMLTIYVNREKIKAITIFLFTIIAFVLFYFTVSRLSFGITIISLMVAVINKIRKDNFVKIGWPMIALIPIFPVCCALSLWSAIAYNPSNLLMKELNGVLGNRLRLGQVSLIKYGVKWFGDKSIEWVGNGLDMFGNKNQDAYLYVDNMYIQILQRYGILFLVVFLILATLLIVRCYMQKENLLMILVALIALRGLIDDATLYLQFNSFWMLFGSAWVGYMSKRKPNIQANKEATLLQHHY